MRRRKRNPETNAEWLKRLYVAGTLTLDALMEAIDAHLEAGKLDDARPDPYRTAIRRSAISPEYAAARWAASASAYRDTYNAAAWTITRALDTLAGSDE